MAEVTFRAPIRPSGRGGGGHLVDVPAEVVEALGGKGRIPVTATFDGVPYRGSIVRMGGGAVLGVQKSIMADAGVAVGDLLTVVVRNDEAPREVEVPDDLAEVLARNGAARAAFESLSFSHKREYVRSVTEAKRPETRARRIELTIEQLVERAAGDEAWPEPFTQNSTTGARSSGAPSRRAPPHARGGDPPRPPSGAPSELPRRAATMDRCVRTRSRVAGYAFTEAVRRTGSTRA